jgi:hypothetical protein
VGLLILLARRHLFPAAAAVTGLTATTAAWSWASGRSVEGVFFDGNWLLFALVVLVYHRLNYARPSGRRKALWAAAWAALAAGWAGAGCPVPAGPSAESVVAAVVFAGVIL